jgi:hypothetical protein
MTSLLICIFILQLIYDTIKGNSSGGSGFDDCLRFFPLELFSGRYITLYLPQFDKPAYKCCFFIQDLDHGPVEEECG